MQAEGSNPAPTPAPAPTRLRLEDGGHAEREDTWILRYDFLKKSSYQLRPRYQPGWKHPWKNVQTYDDYEESIVQLYDNMLDATRITDGAHVMLKLVPTSSPEVEIGTYLRSEEALRRDPRNHAAPILEMLQDPFKEDHTILVMPLLRRVDQPNPVSVRECVDFVEQTLEGLAFLHEHKIAHRDCAQRNILFDGRAMFPSSWHPQATYRFPDGTYNITKKPPTRTALSGVRYYFIDFGISTMGKDMTVGFDGLERAPELSENIPYDPFKLDVYILGMTYREHLVQDHPEMAPLVQPLIDFMTPKEPKDRPTIGEAVKRFQTMKAGWGRSILSQRLRPPAKSENIVSRVINDARFRVSDLWWTTQNPSPPVLPPFV